MPVWCPVCKTKLAGAEVNVAADLAKCGHCGEVFAPSTVLAHAVVSSGSISTPAAEPPVGTKVVIEPAGDGMVIHLPRMGSRSGVGFLTFWVIGWWSILIPLSGAAFGFWGESSSCATSTTWSLLFFVPFYFAGFGVLGLLMYLLFGHTDISFSGLEVQYQTSVLGLSKRWNAPPQQSSVRWVEQGFNPYAAGQIPTPAPPRLVRRIWFWSLVPRISRSATA